jgi:hypothetical protein
MAVRVLQEGLGQAAVVGVMEVAEPGGLRDQALHAAAQGVASAPVAGGLLGPGAAAGPAAGGGAGRSCVGRWPPSACSVTGPDKRGASSAMARNTPSAPAPSGTSRAATSSLVPSTPIRVACGHRLVLVVLTTPDDQWWPFCCANHALNSEVTKSRWSISRASVA